ncbi:protein with ribonuclease H-like and integrase domains [Klebsormidium nitens]|uniref:Protein with ribonuclease H-like and integrase domains n=1 Tax=Klebsormidium nitens TaxID=105231 RepID=A0A1Y1IXH3_KLENI|nr:protein with ribonuclease H-like and integrase domains [Klebsormidium nitens]|eukprot:GAQ92988.1 protein with ribonuclease H-like and integrase domains [Klebsormidium nitens]
MYVLGVAANLISERKGAAPGEDACLFLRKPETAELWHRRMGHAGYENLAKTVQDNLAEGVGVKRWAFRALKTSVCEPCIMGKQTRLPFLESRSASTEPLELSHMDVCGPMLVPSVGGNRKFATFPDDYSKLSVVVPMKQKSKVAKVTEHVINRVELQSGKKLRPVRTDRGKEYVNKALKDVFGFKGTVHDKIAPYTAEQNVSAERLNRQWKRSDGRIIISWDVIFNEGEGDNGVVELSSNPTEGSQEAAGERDTVPAHAHAPASDRCRDARTISETDQVSETVRERRAEPEEIAEDIGMPTSAAQRYPARERHAPGEWYRANLAANTEAREHPGTGEHSEAQSSQEAVGGDERGLWRKSMDEEMRSLLENGTWKTVENPERVKPVPIKWVYKIKRDAHGTVGRYKSRLVAKGYCRSMGLTSTRSTPQ